jgi:hypothetical protein
MLYTTNKANIRFKWYNFTSTEISSNHGIVNTKAVYQKNTQISSMKSVRKKLYRRKKI